MMNPAGKNTGGKGHGRDFRRLPPVFATVQPVEMTRRLQLVVDYRRQEIMVQIVDGAGRRATTVSLSPNMVERLRTKLAEAKGELGWCKEAAV